MSRPLFTRPRTISEITAVATIAMAFAAPGALAGPGYQLDSVAPSIPTAAEAPIGVAIDQSSQIIYVAEASKGLANVQPGQIEQLNAQQKNLENQAAYGTLAVTFGTEVAAVQKAAAQWDPKTEVDRAGASLIGFLQTLTTAAIWFAIVWLPVLIVFAIVLGIGILIARRLGFLRRATPPLPPTPAES